MNKMPHKMLPAMLILLFLLLIAVVAFVYATKDQRHLVISCSFDTSVYDHVKGTDLRKNTHLYLYSNGTGFRTEHGFVDHNNLRYYLDRDSMFIFDDPDGDGTATLEYTQVYKRDHDSLQQSTWGAVSTPGYKLYITLSEIAPNLYLFRERGIPRDICPSIVSE
ncbi:hypothetical protein ACX43S_25240 [Enterobacter cloacae]